MHNFSLFELKPVHPNIFKFPSRDFLPVIFPNGLSDSMSVLTRFLRLQGAAKALNLDFTGNVA